MKIKNLVLIALASIVIFACKSAQTPQKNDNANQMTPFPGHIIYKTKANFDNLVPVGLSENKKDVVSLPAPSDLLKDNELRTPIKLHKGYLLDLRGIGPNTAFIKTSYQEYVKKSQPMSSPDILKDLKEVDPFTEMFRCKYQGNKSELVEWLNKLIDDGQLESKCIKLK